MASLCPSKSVGGPGQWLRPDAKTPRMCWVHPATHKPQLVVWCVSSFKTERVSITLFQCMSNWIRLGFQNYCFTQKIEIWRISLPMKGTAKSFRDCRMKAPRWSSRVRPVLELTRVEKLPSAPISLSTTGFQLFVEHSLDWWKVYFAPGLWWNQSSKSQETTLTQYGQIKRTSISKLLYGVPSSEFVWIYLNMICAFIPSNI